MKLFYIHLLPKHNEKHVPIIAKQLHNATLNWIAHVYRNKIKFHSEFGKQKIFNSITSHIQLSPCCKERYDLVKQRRSDKKEATAYIKIIASRFYSHINRRFQEPFKDWPKPFDKRPREVQKKQYPSQAHFSFIQIHSSVYWTISIQASIHPSIHFQKHGWRHYKLLRPST